MTREEITTMKERVLNSPIFIHHLTVNPCTCGECNPSAHPEHPQFDYLAEVRAAAVTLFAEVTRLQADLRKYDDFARRQG